MNVRDQKGVTLIELLVAMTISTIVMTCVFYILTVFMNDSRYDTFRDQAQNDARSMIDRLSRELRNAASPSSGSGGLLEKATSYDLVFQTVNANQPSGSTSNASNLMRVRYCLGSNNTLWRQTETWTTSSAPSVPDTSACPSTSSSWNQSSNSQPCCTELNDVTNEIGGDTTRPLFTYGPTGYSSTAQIKEVDVNIYTDANPGHLPGPSPELQTGLYLRNELSAPTASFTYTKTAVGSGTDDIQLNASSSTDPNGQSLAYQWYSSGSCPSPTTAISGATTETYDAGHYTSGSSQTFALVVTDTSGLTSCEAQTITT